MKTCTPPTWWVATGLVTLVLLGAAPMSVDEVESRIAASRQRVHSGRLSPVAFQEAVDTLLATQAELIGDYRDDPRRGLWLVQLAVDRCMLIPALDGVGLRVLYGIPSRLQRDRIDEMVREVLALTDEASEAIDRMILELEAQPAYRDDVEARQRRRRLAEEERDRRLPYARGIALTYAAALAAPDESARIDLQRPPEAAAAVELLEPLAARLTPTLAANVRWHAATARMHTGDFDGALPGVVSVIDDPAAAPIDRLAARLCQSKIIQERGGTDAAFEIVKMIQPTDTLSRLLVAERRLAIGYRSGRGQRLAAEIQQYLDETGAVGLPEQTWRAMTLRVLTDLFGGGGPSHDLPAIVRIAQAAAVVEEEGRVVEGIQRLHDLLIEPLEPAERAQTLMLLGRAELAAGDDLAAVRTLTALSSDHADNAGSERAIEVAARIIDRLGHERPRDRDVTAQQRATLDVLLSRYPNLSTVDSWRMRAATLARGEHRLDDALAILQTVAPHAEVWPSAQVERVEILRSQAQSEAVASEMMRRFDVMAEALTHARDAIGRLEQSDPPAHAAAGARLTLAEAASLVARRRYEDAIETLATLRGSGIPSSLRAAATLIRIDAYTALDRGGEVERELHELTAGDDGSSDVIFDMLAQRRGAIETILDDGHREDAVIEARRTLLPLARTLAAWLDDTSDARTPARQIAVADAFVRAEEWRDARRLYDDVLRTSPTIAAAILGLAECLYATQGDAAEAMRLFRRVAVQRDPGDPDYWHAQLRMLQLLERSERHLERIAPHVRQLRQKDDELGGLRYRPQFEALARRHG